jgi:hypothetical protein
MLTFDCQLYWIMKCLGDLEITLLVVSVMAFPGMTISWGFWPNGWINPLIIWWHYQEMVRWKVGTSWRSRSLGACSWRDGYYFALASSCFLCSLPGHCDMIFPTPPNPPHHNRWAPLELWSKINFSTLRSFSAILVRAAQK